MRRTCLLRPFVFACNEWTDIEHTILYADRQERAGLDARSSLTYDLPWISAGAEAPCRIIEICQVVFNI